MHFPISGVDINPLVLVGVAFIISFFASIAGLSGAFVLLPFQVSVLKFTSPAVSPTNLVFNVIAIPSGVYRYYREGRMVWPLTWVIITGTIPGIFIGAVFRIRFFSGARAFKFFVGWVLLYMGYRLIADLLRRTPAASAEARAFEEDLKRRTEDARRQLGQRRFSGLPAKSTILVTEVSFRRISYDFYGHTFSFNPIILFVLSLVVGVIGGIYGIGGGAIIAPFIVTFFGLPVYTIAGATLMSTFATSSAGILVYLYLAYFYAGSGLAIAPDWLLGAFFGVGGFAGVYLGARTQRFVPQRIIKAGLAIIITFLAVRYIFGFLW
jgi:uncharacterized membrane protein YfcA